MLFVVGPHRSGTSIATLVLNTCGFDLGGPLIPANSGNETGYWEHQEGLALNDLILEVSGRAWNDPRPIELSDMRLTRRYEALVEKAGIILKDIGSASHPGAIKDPRLCRTLPIWLDACREREKDAKALIIVRDPLSCAKSLVVRDGGELNAGLLLWTRYMIDALQCTQGMPVSLIEYERLLARPEETVATALAELGLRAPNEKADLKSLFKPVSTRAEKSTGAPSTFIEETALALFAGATAGLTEFRNKARETDFVLQKAYEVFRPVIDTHLDQRYSHKRDRELLGQQIGLLEARADLAEARLRAVKAERELEKLSKSKE